MSPHASHGHHLRDQRIVETNRIANEDDDTAELPAAEETLGSTTAIVRSINFMKKPSTVTMSLVTILGGFGAWMWMLHQRTDHIPVIESKIDGIQGSVDRIESILIKKALDR